MKKYLLATLLSLIGCSAFAACPTPITVKDAAGTTQNMTTVDDGSGNCIGATIIFDAAGVNKLTIKAASTAPVATDPAAVVALSPNSLGGTSGNPSFTQVTNTNANGQATAANSSPVVLPAAQVTADPCSLNTKVNFTISTTAGTLQLVAPSGSTQVYICSLFTVGATASIQNIVGGTGSTCTTGTPVAIAGSTTAANGMSFAANGGFTFGNGGGTILRTTTAGHGVCLIQSATAQISGGGTYVQQ